MATSPIVLIVHASPKQQTPHSQCSFHLCDYLGCDCSNNSSCGTRFLAEQPIQDSTSRRQVLHSRLSIQLLSSFQSIQDIAACCPSLLHDLTIICNTILVFLPLLNTIQLAHIYVMRSNIGCRAFSTFRLEPWGHCPPHQSYLRFRYQFRRRRSDPSTS